MERNRDLLVVGNLAKDIIMGEVEFGGCAASIAVNCRRMGLRTGVMSVLGKDKFSSKYEDFLESKGVDISLVRSDLEILPICEVISKENSISSSVWVDNGCHQYMETMPFNEEYIQKYTLIHLVSCPPMLARRISDKLSGRLSYEPGPMLTVDGRYFDMGVAVKSELIFFNEEEFDVACRSNPGLLETLVGHRRKRIVVTKGSKGSEVYGLKDSLESVHFESVPVSKVVDSTGAGDCYKSGFFSAYLRNCPLDDAVKLGTVAGSLGIQQKGGILDKKSILKINKVLNYV